MTEQERYGRELEEDHDLLTFNESAARLRQEIAETRATLSDLAEDDPSRGAVQRRLDELLVSQSLIEAQSEQNAEGRRFVDYRPQDNSRSGR